MLLLFCCGGGCGRDETAATPSAPPPSARSEVEATAMSGTDLPTGPAYRGEGFTRGGRWWVRWETGPQGLPELEPFSLLVEVRESPEGAAAPQRVVVTADAAMPHHGHGMNLVPRTTQRGAGRFEIEGMLFHMGGRWELFIDVEQGGVLERAQWTLEVD
jgi:hypothetical protein